MSTPHISANKGDIAETILLPGDPLRAKYVAENYLENPVQFNEVRNMLGYTGTYKGKRISVMGSGMGVASTGIYSNELIKFYGVKNLIRVGSCGAFDENLQLYDIILAMGACTNSNYAHQYELPGTYSAIASWELLSKAKAVADEKNIDVHIGNILASDFYFYEPNDSYKKWANMNVLAGDTGCYALYCNAARTGVNALTILTVSDSIPLGIETSSTEREKGFTKMMEIAIELA